MIRGGGGGERQRPNASPGLAGSIPPPIVTFTAQ